MIYYIWYIISAVLSIFDSKVLTTHHPQLHLTLILPTSDHFAAEASLHIFAPFLQHKRYRHQYTNAYYTLNMSTLLESTQQTANNLTQAVHSHLPFTLPTDNAHFSNISDAVKACNNPKLISKQPQSGIRSVLRAHVFDCTEWTADMIARDFRCFTYRTTGEHQRSEIQIWTPHSLSILLADTSPHILRFSCFHDLMKKVRLSLSPYVHCIQFPNTPLAIHYYHKYSHILPTRLLYP